MRTIKFRGKRKDNNEWVYGDLTHKVKTYAKGSEDTVTIFHGQYEYGEYDDFEIDPETAGQFTGMLDMNGVEIYEGDIVLDSDDYLLVQYDTDCGQYVLKGADFEEYFMNVSSKGVEVYGNIHDTPELINDFYKEV